MTILVTGANGQLGNEIRIIAKQSPDRYIFTDVIQAEAIETVYLDITNLPSIRQLVADNNVTAVVNCASFTDVNAAESNQKMAEKLNADGAENLAVAMNEVNGLLIHISTDYVFGGNSFNTPCTEEQDPAPTSVYGLSKLHGEQKIIATSCNHVIIRTAWLYSAFGRNFCKTILNLTATKPSLNVVFDQVGTPTYASDLAKVISVILSDYNASASATYPKNGIYHYSNEGVCSWFDFAKKIAELSGNTQCNIRPCHSYDYPSPVKRPSYSVLDKTKIKSTFGIDIPYWTDSLKNCIASIISNIK